MGEEERLVGREVASGSGGGDGEVGWIKNFGGLGCDFRWETG